MSATRWRSGGTGFPAQAHDNAARIVYDGGAAPVPADVYRAVAALLKRVEDTPHPAWDRALLRWVHTRISAVHPLDAALPASPFDFGAIQAFFVRTLCALSAVLRSRATGGARAYRDARVPCASGCGQHTAWRCELLEDDRAGERRLNLFLLANGSAQIALDGTPIAMMNAPARPPGDAEVAALRAHRLPVHQRANVVWQHTVLALADAADTGASRHDCGDTGADAAHLAALVPQQVALSPAPPALITTDADRISADTRAAIAREMNTHPRTAELLRSFRLTEFGVEIERPIARAAVSARAMANFVAYVTTALLHSLVAGAQGSVANLAAKVCKQCSDTLQARQVSACYLVTRAWSSEASHCIDLVLIGPTRATVWLTTTYNGTPLPSIPLAELQEQHVTWRHDVLRAYCDKPWQ